MENKSKSMTDHDEGDVDVPVVAPQRLASLAFESAIVFLHEVMSHARMGDGIILDDAWALKF